jgi:endoglycosylceramidase
MRLTSFPILLVLALAAASSSSSCSSSPSSSSTSENVKQKPTSWHVSEGAIRDVEGRSVVLRGVNFAGTHKQKPYLSDFGPPDLERLKAEYGFNALRVLILWAAIEPEKGVFDEKYLDGLEERIRWARDANMLVVLDMHQDLYGEGFAGGDGAPKWTCDGARYAAFKPTTPWFLGSLDTNVMACVDNLYAEGGEQRAHFIEAWRHVAARLAKYENIVGFDILNEPHWGSYSILAFEIDRLASFYTDVAKGVREVAPNWLIFAEPGSNRNVGYPSSLPKLPFEGVVYAPHSYDREAESGNGFDASRRSAVLDNVAKLKEEADALGAALFIGEYGGVADDPGITPYMTAQYDAAGAAGASSMYWALDKGDGGYSLLKTDGSEKKELADVLVRPYPTRVTGKLLSYAFDPNTKTGTIRYINDSTTIAGTTDIIVPSRVWPNGARVDCGGCTVEEAGGGVVHLKNVPSGESTITISSK